MRFQVVFQPSDEGGYTVYVPSLPGCISEGDTIEEALANIREAVELYLEPVEDDWVVGEGLLVRELVSGPPGSRGFLGATVEQSDGAGQL